MVTRIEAILKQRLARVPQAGFFIPHQYQERVIVKMVREVNVGLFLDPGLGKTPASLEAFCRLKKMGKTKGALVIAPVRVCKSTWPNEVKKWANFRHLKVEVVHGRDKLQAIRRPADIYLINPEALHWLITVALRGKRDWPFDTLIVDESSKFKNYASKRHKFLRSKLYKFDRVWTLTGSPAPNSLLDIYGHFWLIDRGATFGTFAQYKERYFYRSGYMGRDWEIKPGSEEAIHKAIAPKVVAMNAEDYLDLPPLITNDLFVEMPDKIMGKYREMEKELYTELGAMSFEALTKSSAAQKCHQLAGGALYDDLDELERLKGKVPANRKFTVFHDEKIEALLELAEELQGKPLLIGHYYNHEAKRINEALCKRFRMKSIPTMNRDTTPAQSDKIINDWNAGRIRFLNGQFSAMAHGLNMQDVIAEIFLYSLTYNLDDYQQFIKRVWRQGQNGRIVLTRCLCRGTVDERVAKSLVIKGGRQQDVFEALKER